MKMKKHIIYLAAGNSRRFGANKLLHEYQGKPLYQHGLDMLQEAVKENNDIFLTVVTQYREIEKELNKRKIRVIRDEECKKGISYSICAGLRSIEPILAEDYVMFVVADQPYLTKKTVLSLMECADGETETASVRYGERPGNPVLFSMRFKEELLSLKEDQGGRAVMQKHHCRYVYVPDEKELLDIDVKKDINWQELEKYD